VSRVDPKYKPFDPASIYEISLMCRSDFGKQEGEFELVVESISGWQQRTVHVQGERGRARDGCWSWVKGWFMPEGQVTLGNAEK
jgi:hypothetical protein